MQRQNITEDKKKINETVKKALNGWKKNEISCIFSYEL